MIKTKRKTVIFLIGLFLLQPITIHTKEKKIGPIKIKTTLTGLTLQAQALGLEKHIYVFDKKNTEKISTWIDKTHKTLTWILEKRIPQKSAWILPRKTRERICEFLEEQKQEVQKSKRKLLRYQMIARVVRWLPFFASGTYICLPLLQKTETDLTKRTALGLAIGCLAGYGAYHVLHTREHLIEKMIALEKLIEEVIQAFQGTSKPTIKIEEKKEEKSVTQTPKKPVTQQKKPVTQTLQLAKQPKEKTESTKTTTQPKANREPETKVQATQPATQAPQTAVVKPKPKDSCYQKMEKSPEVKTENPDTPKEKIKKTIEKIVRPFRTYFPRRIS